MQPKRRINVRMISMDAEQHRPFTGLRRDRKHPHHARILSLTQYLTSHVSQTFIGKMAVAIV